MPLIVENKITYICLSPTWINEGFLFYVSALLFTGVCCSCAPPVFSKLVGSDIGSLQFQLTPLSVRHFTLDCHLKSPDYGQQLPAVS